MRRLSILLLLFVTLFLARPAFAGEGQDLAAQVTVVPRIYINSPYPGQALQGSVPIEGNTDIPGFKAAYLYFAYTNNPTDTWFLIYEDTSPVTSGTLTQWDTTTITDGNYDLRIIVTLEDGSQLTDYVSGLRVRNYSPIETNTPTVPPAVATTIVSTPGDNPLPTGTPTPNPTPTASPTPIPPTPTSLPRNPAELSLPTIFASLGRGALIAVGLFALLGIYLAARSARRTRK
jgi:hypothetical protein